MSPPRLHVPDELAAGRMVPLAGDRAHYLRTVLRLRDGAPVRLFNATAGEWSGRIAGSGRHRVEIELDRCLRVPVPEPGPTLVFAPIRRNRLDWLVEKAVELGVARLVPVLTERAVARPDNAARLAAIAVEAAEQSERLTVPVVATPQTLSHWLEARDPAAPRPALQKAHEIIVWVRLLGEDVKGATVALAQVKRFGPPDPALAAAVHRALGEIRQARKILEEARAAGDDRKEVVGPLIQILIEQGEVARAAAQALDIVDSLSDEDARKMAEISFDSGAFEWSARLYEAVFRRNGAGEDAYDDPSAELWVMKADGSQAPRKLDLANVGPGLTNSWEQADLGPARALGADTGNGEALYRSQVARGRGLTQLLAKLLPQIDRVYDALSARLAAIQRQPIARQRRKVGSFRCAFT